MIQKRIVGVIGTGKVGMAAAYAMFLRQTAGEIILVDKDSYRAQGEAMDLMHGQPYVGNILVRAGEIADLGAAQVVVFREIIEGLDRCAPNAVLVVASNPVDILTHAAQMLSRRPSGRIVGTGTMLDSARFRALLGEHYGVDPRSVHAYIIGEHGDTEVPVWSSALIGSLPIAGTTVLGRTFDADLMKNLFGRVRDAAADIIARKGYTSSAIGIVIARLVEAIMEDQKPVLTVSARLDGEYGLEGVCLSLPRVVGLSGVEAVILPRLDEKEMQGLADSAAFLRRTLEAMTTAHLP